MKIKELQKVVNIAWSPIQQNPIYLVAGTAAQQLDFNGTSTLEIYSPNFNDPSFDLELKASLPSQYRFQKIIWSPIGYDGMHRNGLIVGGCEGGHVMIYSASKILSNEEGLVARQDKHTGPVTGLDVNPFQKNLLASCASESEIFIWDLNNTTTHMNPGAKTQPLEDVQNVAWNRQVQHILASVFSSRCVIWDLRKSEQIIKLSDTQSRVRWHAIQWHPEVATQVWLASEDDQAPVVQLWDLRYATAPAKTMQIHQRGVLGMSWCSQDSDLMVSCGKDNRIYCWNPNTELADGEILSEVAATATWYADVQWCPRNPALIASSSLDGNVSIYSMFGGTQQQVQTSNKIADSFPGMDQIAQAPLPQQSTQTVYHDLKHAPKWLKPHCGVAFGFGGKLISFNGKSKVVNISQVVTEPQLVQRANTLDQSMTAANYVDYCLQRADEMSDQDGRYLWFFIKANFELNPKEEMLNLLGYNKDDIDKKFAKFVKGSESVDRLNVDELSNRISNITHKTLDNDATFDGIAASQKQVDSNVVLEKPKRQFKIPSGDHPDSLITEALLTGNIDAAVELCIEANRIAEALIIASTEGIDLLTKVQNRFLKTQENELSDIILALVTRNWFDFVNNCTVDSWKNALIATLRHSDRKAIDICERLGDRIISECGTSVEYMSNAMLCYVCAGSLDKIVNTWYKMKQLENKNDNYHLNTNELQELAEVTMLMNKSLEQQGVSVELSGRFGDFIVEYSSLLASQGALNAALNYIFSLAQNATGDLYDLRERIYNAVNSNGSELTHKLIAQSEHQQPIANIYSRQQQSRGSFSQPVVKQQPMFQPLHQQQQQYQSNIWNPAQINTGVTVTTSSTFNTITPIAQPIKSLQGAAELSQPPRPPSATSSQGGNSVSLSGGSGLLSRSKYVLDPSVQSSAMGYGGNYASSAPLQTASIPQNSFNTNPFTNAPLGGGIGALGSQPAVAQLQSNYNANAFSIPASANPNMYAQGVAPIDTAAHQPGPQNIQRNPTPPPGWNDPPTLKSTRAPRVSETKTTASAPITHPILGSDPNQNQNGYLDPNAAYQQGGIMPPPPTANSIQNNAYYNPNTTLTQNNNNPLLIGGGAYQPQGNFTTSAIHNTANQAWNTQASHSGYTEHNAVMQQQSAPPQRQMEVSKEKPPLPEEYIYMQTVFEELKSQCLTASSDARIKRKFVDVSKRLENLYDCLRDSRLTSATITALNQIVQYIQIGDYGNALQTHTQIAFGADFSQCAGFMPGLKVLMQSAADLQVYLR